MKINFLLPHLKISGGVRVILTYADLLTKKGHTVRLIVRSANKFRRTIANLFGLGRPWWIKSCQAKVLRVSDFKETSLPPAEIVVATNWPIAFEVANYSEKIGQKFYFVQHDERLYHGPRQEVDKALRLPMKKIVVSSWLKEIFKKEYGQTSELLLNSVDKETFHPIEVKRDDSSVRVLMLHHTYGWKGSRDGLSAFSRVKKLYPNIRLILFGSRNEKIDLPCDEYYYQPQEKLAWLYSSCHIYLCPSWDEGFGLPSLEAMACKCALLTYDNGGSRDYAFDGQTALVAERRDVDDLTRKLELLVREKDLRERLAKAGYQFVQQMPTYQEQTDKLEGIFQKAIAKQF